MVTQLLPYFCSGLTIIAAFNGYPDTDSKQWRVSLGIQIIPAGILALLIMLYQIYNSLIALFGQFCCMMLIDRLGRRGPLILGNLANMVTFIIATILLAQYPPETNRNNSAAWGFIAMTWLYNFSFSSTCGPLSWVNSPYNV